MAAGRRLGPQGFTLIELLVTIALIVIMATIAVPGFNSLLTSNRLAADYNELLSGLNRARSEAVKRREMVTAVVTRMGDSGWKLEVEVGDGSLDCSSPAGEANCLWIRDMSSSPVSISTSSHSQISFNALGRLSGLACREVVISHDGRSKAIRVGIAGKVGKECV